MFRKFLFLLPLIIFISFLMLISASYTDVQNQKINELFISKREHLEEIKTVGQNLNLGKEFYSEALYLIDIEKNTYGAVFIKEDEQCTTNFRYKLVSKRDAAYDTPFDPFNYNEFSSLLAHPSGDVQIAWNNGNETLETFTFFTWAGDYLLVIGVDKNSVRTPINMTLTIGLVVCTFLFFLSNIAMMWLIRKNS